MIKEYSNIVITKSNTYLLVLDSKHLVEFPRDKKVYSIRYKDIINFGETENSYLNECYEIIAHRPLGDSKVLDNINLASNLELNKYSESQAKEIWKAGQEYWKTSGESITFEELTENFKIKLVPPRFFYVDNNDFSKGLFVY
jgi:hypothetical protein